MIVYDNYDWHVTNLTVDANILYDQNLRTVQFKPKWIERNKIKILYSLHCNNNVSN